MERKTAEDMAAEQKEISVSEFFEKNKHLLGFDNPTKALMMCVKEAVDNSLDACEEAGIVPDLIVKVKAVKEDVYRISIQDNGPGIVKEQLPKIFGKLLYGSKFHRMKQSRGQQGIGISASVLYSQLTTGKPAFIWSKTESGKKVNYLEMHINTMKNEPEIVKEETLENTIITEHGTKIEMEVVGRYRKSQGVDDYLKQTSIANPCARIVYHAPDGTKMTFPRSTNELPKEPKEIKPHPYGMEFGILSRMLINSKSKTLSSFLINEFSSTGATSANEICKVAKIDKNKKPQTLARGEVENILNAMQKVKLQRPPTDCLSPIGEAEIERSLKKEYPDAEFIAAVTREPTVYKGNPFQIEIAIVYSSEFKSDSSVEILRLANRVPLMYQAGAGATVEALRDTDWKRYGLSKSGNSLPSGPAIIMVHMVSVWVPFISESKEAIAPYPEIVKEMKLALQDAGRKLSRYLSGKRRSGEHKRRLQIFERYAPEVAEALHKLTGKPEKELAKKLKDLIKDRANLREVDEDGAEESGQGTGKTGK